MALEAGRAAPQAPRALPPLPAAPSPASPPAAEGALFTRCHHGYTSSSLLPASLCGLPVAGCPRELAARWGWLRHRVPHPAPRVAGSCGLPQLPSTLLADLPPPGPAGPEHGLEGEVGDPGCARAHVCAGSRSLPVPGAQRGLRHAPNWGGGHSLGVPGSSGCRRMETRMGAGRLNPPGSRRQGGDPRARRAMPRTAPARRAGCQPARPGDGEGRGESRSQPGTPGVGGGSRGSWGSPGPRAPRPLPIPRAVPAA